MEFEEFLLDSLKNKKIVISLQDSSYNTNPEWIHLKDEDKINETSYVVRVSISPLKSDGHHIDNINLIENGLALQNIIIYHSDEIEKKILEKYDISTNNDETKKSFYDTFGIKLASMNMLSIHIHRSYLSSEVNPTININRNYLHEIKSETLSDFIKYLERTIPKRSQKLDKLCDKIEECDFTFIVHSTGIRDDYEIILNKITKEELGKYNNKDNDQIYFVKMLNSIPSWYMRFTKINEKYLQRLYE